MARNQTLISLLDDLRAETRSSLNAAHNAQIRDTQVKYLRKAQEWFWDDFDWPHLYVERRVSLQAGERYYEPPTDVRIDHVTRIEVRYGGVWIPLVAGIGGQQYAEFDSDLDIRSWPVRRWRIHEDEQIEIWPVPESNADTTTLEGVLKIAGIRNLKLLVTDTDRCDLDDRLLVLYAAAKFIGKGGEAKMAEAMGLYGDLRGKLMPRRRFRMLGADQEVEHRPRRMTALYIRS